MNKQTIDALLQKINDSATSEGNPRTKTIVNRIVKDLFHTIEDLDVTPGEFWTALNYLGEAGQNGELGLLVAGLGFEHFLDLRLDEAEARAGLEGGTPRTIEGPLYVAGAPASMGHARLDDGTDPGDTLVMRGRVLGEDGRPLANALVEVWHANHLGNYSFFDKSQPAFNLRRSIRTGFGRQIRVHERRAGGLQRAARGKTQQLLDQLGRMDIVPRTSTSSCRRRGIAS